MCLRKFSIFSTDDYKYIQEMVYYIWELIIKKNNNSFSETFICEKYNTWYLACMLVTYISCVMMKKIVFLFGV